MSSRNLLLLSRGGGGAQQEKSGPNVRRVLLLYVGGTIGMKNTPTGWVPSKGLLARLLTGNNKFHDPGHAEGTMPISQWGKRVIWTLQERDVLLDSSDMDHTDWEWIAKEIFANYDAYDGFVLIQGTDTLTYTSSALSFMLRYLRKTVVVTGSQVPMLILPNDAESNLFGAICIAAHFEIPEVCVFFNGSLLRGNRTTKLDASGFDAFVSHNYPPLLTWGPVVDINWTAIRTAAEVEFLQNPFSIVSNMGTDVAVLRLFPFISESFIRGALQPPLRGCVLTTYGQGNISLRAKHIMQCLAEANSRGVLLVNVTQCNRGSVKASYATGRALLDVGVQPGHDMTCEAALCKLAFLLGRVDAGEMTLDEARKKISIAQRGELTEAAPMRVFSFREGISAFVETMGKMVQSSVASALYPVLLCSAAVQGDLASLETLVPLAGLNVRDVEGRTPLHLAASKGHLDIVRYLVELAKVPRDVLDRENKTPLDLVPEECSELREYLIGAGCRSGQNLQELKSNFE